MTDAMLLPSAPHGGYLGDDGSALTAVERRSVKTETALIHQGTVYLASPENKSVSSTPCSKTGEAQATGPPPVAAVASVAPSKPAPAPTPEAALAASPCVSMMPTTLSEVVAAAAAMTSMSASSTMSAMMPMMPMNSMTGTKPEGSPAKEAARPEKLENPKKAEGAKGAKEAAEGGKEALPVAAKTTPPPNNRTTAIGIAFGSLAGISLAVLCCVLFVMLTRKKSKGGKKYQQ